MLLVQQTGPRPTAPALSFGPLPGARIRPFRPFGLLKKNEIERNWRRAIVLRTKRAAWAVRAVDEDAQELLDETQASGYKGQRALAPLVIDIIVHISYIHARLDSGSPDAPFCRHWQRAWPDSCWGATSSWWA